MEKLPFGVQFELTRELKGSRGRKLGFDLLQSDDTAGLDSLITARTNAQGMAILPTLVRGAIDLTVSQSTITPILVAHWNDPSRIAASKILVSRKI